MSSQGEPTHVPYRKEDGTVDFLPIVDKAYTREEIEKIVEVAKGEPNLSTLKRRLQFHWNAEKWMKELTEIRDTMEHYNKAPLLSGKLTNVILEMSEDYYGLPRQGIYDEG